MGLALVVGRWRCVLVVLQLLLLRVLLFWVMVFGRIRITWDCGLVIGNKVAHKSDQPLVFELKFERWVSSSSFFYFIFCGPNCKSSKAKVWKSSSSLQDLAKKCRRKKKVILLNLIWPR